jgi:hypothetical protein
MRCTQYCFEKVSDNLFRHAVVVELDEAMVIEALNNIVTKFQALMPGSGEELGEVERRRVHYVYTLYHTWNILNGLVGMGNREAVQK